jgi:hypothetical protein
MKLQTGNWLPLFSACAIGLLLCGCATRKDTAQPKPNKGISEYRQIAGEAQRSVAAMVQALEALTTEHTDSTKPHPKLARFDRALHDLELTSVKTRSRAEAIIARGEAYFDEWKENLSAITNQPAARMESQRYTRMLEHFGRIRERSGDVRTEFRPFMAKLREFRATVDSSGNLASGDSPRVTIGLVAASGRRVLAALGGVTKALDEAEMELRAIQASKP